MLFVCLLVCLLFRANCLLNVRLKNTFSGLSFSPALYTYSFVRVLFLFRM
ncbi:hypothetical protein HMPREF9445_00606 [Bacteroides clarus YIT 12056]|uniref:Uncharacterized protein n=1 Tax=Bacteroides clarus YIT 12056 TaxID=762984 RepID=A0ABN0CRW2_9BACE|nr:hypothetical protein HMPREF9445_00606 [Bacteroides clarus YIT 12056]